MRVIRDLEEMQAEVNNRKIAGKTIGFVPTMGFLHRGHLSLIEEARKQTDYVVMSIFVNPLQFGVGEDYEEYPRDLDSDIAKAESVGCDMIFYPEVKAMYPGGYNTFVNVDKISEPLCGGWRAGHFRGVTTVVNKLFNLVDPDKAFFGQKDAQQSIVIKRMVSDLNMKVEVVVCPTVREADGLAMSSRNAYLKPDERAAAVIINRTLNAAKDKINSGERDAGVIKDFMITNIGKEPLADSQYIEIVDVHTLQRTEEIKGEILLAVAVKFGDTRLIDNIALEVQ